MFSSIYQAFCLINSGRLARNGNPSAAKIYIDRIKNPIKNKAIVESMRAYLQIVNDEFENARFSIYKARNLASIGTDSGRFVRTYCDFLEAILNNNVRECNRLSMALTEWPNDSLARSILVVVPPMFESHG